MASVFMSYSHKDGQLVSRVVKRFEEAGHKPLIDQKFLAVGDSISTQILGQIRSTDFVAVFLSRHSTTSKWVRQEILETVHRELETHKVRLLPCLLEACELPEALVSLKHFGRLYQDFTSDFDTALHELCERVGQGHPEVFATEQYLKLDLPIAGLEVYLTGEPWNWQTNPELRYGEMVDGYLLYGFRLEPWSYFKNFVLCDEPDAQKVRAQLQNAGFNVTGVGDKDPSSRRRRVWFTIPGFAVDGSPQNNQWPGTRKL